MNTMRGSHTDKVQKLIASLGFSPNNQALALEYLTAETCDDTLLERAEPQDFSGLGWEPLKVAVSHLSALYASGDHGLAARYVKLYWAIGRSTAIFPLGYSRYATQQLWDRDESIRILGKPAVAAMEAEHWVQGFTPLADETVWLHQLAAEEPEALEAAQQLGGTRLANIKVVLAGVLLCHAGEEKPGLLKRFLGGDSITRRQGALLCQLNVNSLVNTASALCQEDRERLADYIRKGEPQAAVPVLASARCAVDAQSALTTKAVQPGSAFLLLGTASFLAQRRDPRARCAVRAYLALNPMPLLGALLRSVPHAYLMDQLPALRRDVPGGSAVLLLALSNAPARTAAAFELAEQCRSALPLAQKLADTRQYTALCQLFPERMVGSARESITGLLEKHIQAGHGDLRAYLSDTGSLQDSAARLARVTPPPYFYNAALSNLVYDYRTKAGWDAFACRCMVVLGLVMKGRTMDRILRQTGPLQKEDVSAPAKALLEQGLPLPQLLQVFDALHDSVYSDDTKAVIRNGVYSVLARPEYVQELRVASKSGGVFARYTAISALDDLTNTDACAAEAKAGVLDCVGDSSKQIQELLLSILPAHEDWVPDFTKMLKSKKAAERLMAVGVGRRLGNALRPALEEALTAEKSAKVSDAIRTALGQAAAAPDETVSETPGELAQRVLKGGKKRKIQWILDTPLPVLHHKDGTEAGEDIRAALMVAYCDLGRIGRSETAAEIAKDLNEADLSALAHEVYEKWLAEGAQSKTKWVLPFAAAFGGPSMTPKLTRAINDWPQHARGAIACDAVTALALSTDPAALLTVDAISRKFKFRQVKTAAGQALENAARELGITAEELADRIVPDLGFAADGKRVFDYGQRSFTVRLTPTLELEITNDAGKAVKNLPSPGKTDDEEKAGAAYAEFKLMKKQIKTTVTAQRARLEAALSALRCWSADAWRALFVGNPIMHQFAMSLIWGVYEDGKLETTFRYMEDGSFNTVDEEEYQLPEAALIGLVHPIELDGDTLEGWKQQLEDYEIVQSVPQLDRPVYRLESDMEQAHSLERFGGKILNGLSLSGKLQGLGWYRGSVQDAGVYCTFYREDAALNMGVELNFSGSYVGDENDTVTVYDAVFYRAGTVTRGSYCYDTPKDENIFALKDIPPRYYSEIVYQLDRATASSTETDPEWKTKK